MQRVGPVKTPPEQGRRNTHAPQEWLTIETLDPITDPRWAQFVGTHPGATAFHTPAWFRALRDTYGYRPVVMAQLSGDSIASGVAGCVVRSALTGKRLVAIPFADHGGILAAGADSATELAVALRACAERHGCGHVELRALPGDDINAIEAAGFGPAFHGTLHELDLAPTPEQLFRAFHKSSIVRKIRKAEKEKLAYESGDSDVLLDAFYRLTIETRRKHRLPPQPRAWFRNLLDAFGGRAKLHVARSEGHAVAAIFTLALGDRYIYKYGCSDTAQTNLGGTPMVFWRAIREAKEQGFRVFDMGRTELHHEGLATFKERWGAEPKPLWYYRAPAPDTVDEGRDGRLMRFAMPVFERLPDSVLVGIGRALYRHMG